MSDFVKQIGVKTNSIQILIRSFFHNRAARRSMIYKDPSLAVSYTHLDVYKRQVLRKVLNFDK